MRELARILRTFTSVYSAIVCACIWNTACTATATRSKPVICNTTGAQVLSALLRELGAPPRSVGIRLALSDSEFAMLKRDFEMNPPRFTYAQVKRGGGVADEEVISVRSLEIGSNTASVRLSFQRKSSFTDVRYRLMRDHTGWRVVAREFICAS
jgi:hypothetical protein